MPKRLRKTVAEGVEGLVVATGERVVLLLQGQGQDSSIAVRGSLHSAQGRYAVVLGSKQLEGSVHTVQQCEGQPCSNMRHPRGGGSSSRKVRSVDRRGYRAHFSASFDRGVEHGQARTKNTADAVENPTGEPWQTDAPKERAAAGVWIPAVP